MATVNGIKGVVMTILETHLSYTVHFKLVCTCVPERNGSSELLLVAWHVFAAGPAVTADSIIMTVFDASRSKTTNKFVEFIYRYMTRL